MTTKDKQIQNLRVANLKFRIEIEELIFYPDGKVAERIRAKYRRKRAIREEIDLSTKN